MSGRSSISYRALSRCLVSLASAGSVCCAKPNHGFSGCQQASATFSRRLPRTLKRTAFPLHRACVSHYPAHGHFANTGVAAGLCFQCLQRSGQLFTTFLIGYFFATLSLDNLPAGDTRSGSRRYRHACRFSRRTSGFARKLRRHRARPIDAGARNRRSDARLIARTTPAFASAGTSPKKPAALGGRSGSIRKHELSGRLPRAVRHSRPGRAVP